MPPFLSLIRLRWLASSAALLLLACSQKPPAESAADADAGPLTVPVVRLMARDTVVRHDYVADVQAVRNVEIRGRVEGYLKQIFVDEGQFVRKDQPLFRIDDAPYRTQLAKAHAARANAQATARVAALELQRVQLLVAKDIISKTELEVARAKVAAAQADIEMARAAEAQAEEQLSYTLIKAPFDGLVDRIPLKVGSVVEDGTLLTTVSDTRAVFAYFGVSENEYLRYRKTQGHDSARAANEAHLILADGTEYPLTGRIETVEGEFEATTGSIAFRARFANPDHLLKHGATGKVRITNTVTKAVLVPQQAVFEVQDHNYVFVLDPKTRTVQQRAFKPKTRLGEFYLVADGLQAGDEVVCEGVQHLTEGDTVRPRALTFAQLVARGD